MRKRKTNYPPAKTDKRPARPDGLPGDRTRSTVATIDVDAAKGRSGLVVGGRVRVTGSGPYSNETVTITKLISGVIAQAIVTTDAGDSRRVRTIDLEPIPASSETPPAEGRPTA